MRQVLTYFSPLQRLFVGFSSERKIKTCEEADPRLIMPFKVASGWLFATVGTEGTFWVLIRCENGSRDCLENFTGETVLSRYVESLQPAPVKTDRAVWIQQTNQVKVNLSSINQSIKRFTIKFYAWLIDLIHRRKNCPTGMISGWVQKVTEHRGTIQ